MVMMRAFRGATLSRILGVIRIALLGVTMAITAPIVASSEAKTAVTLDPIGTHYPIFVVEKNENPQNILVAYTRLDSKCHVVEDPATKKPFLDYYWMMDREHYKPVHRLIKSGIRDRLEVQPVSTGGGSIASSAAFSVRVNDLKELRQDLGTPLLSVETKTQGDGCDVEAYIVLGPSDQNRRLHLETIYTESKTSFLPPFRKVVSVTLKSESFERKYLAR